MARSLKYPNRVMVRLSDEAMRMLKQHSIYLSATPAETIRAIVTNYLYIFDQQNKEGYNNDGQKNTNLS